MFGLSYRTWPDPVVDFGAQLYFADRIAHGEVLYRDIAYFNGPLSVHFNALLFRVFGSSLNTLIVTNTLILMAIAVMLYALLERAGGRFPALVGCAIFLLVFAFGQYTPMGNYNYITPYTQEMTHGFALSLASVLMMLRFVRTNRTPDAIITGVLVGLTFLTKAEPFIAVVAGAIVPLPIWMSVTRKLPRNVIWLAVTAIAFVAIAFLVLCINLAPRDALVATLGSWTWVFDRRITSLNFYQWVSGFDEPGQNLSVIGRWTVGYLGCFSVAIGAGFAGRWVKPPALAGAIAGVAVGSALIIMPIAWNETGRALPVIVGVAGVITIVQLFRARGGLRDVSPTLALLALVGLAAGYLLKVPLNARISHYGFVLGVPAVMVVIVLTLEVFAKWVAKVGGSALAVRLVAMGMIGVATWVHVQVSNQFWMLKTERIGDGANWFYGDERGADVLRNIELLRRTVARDQTLAVVPQGLMINFLVDRRNPLSSPNFMPPEMIARGEEALLRELSQKRPDYVLLNLAELDEDAMKLEADRYGRSVIRWLREEYEVVSPWVASSRFILLRGKEDRAVADP